MSAQENPWPPSQILGQDPRRATISPSKGNCRREARENLCPFILPAGAVKKLVTNCAARLCQLGMNDERDPLLSFRASTDRWADRARAEAKAVRLAVAEGPDGVTVAVHRLRLIVQHIRIASDGALDAIATLRRSTALPPTRPTSFRP
jgi:hypothetical protein